MQYQTVLFDLDGTLLNTFPGILKNAKMTLETLGQPAPSDEALRLFVGPPLKECFTDVCGLDEETAEKAIAVYRKYYLETGNVFDCEPYEGIPELLKRLREDGRKLGVATSKAEPLAKLVLEKKGLSGYFDIVCGAPLKNADATKADSIRSALRALSCTDLRDAVLVGDRHFDAMGAHVVGIDSIGVLYGFGSEEEIRGTFPTVAETVEELTQLLLG